MDIYNARQYRFTKTASPPQSWTYNHDGTRSPSLMRPHYADLLAGVVTKKSREDVLQTLGVTTQPEDVKRRALENLFLSDWLKVECRDDGQEWVAVSSRLSGAGKNMKSTTSSLFGHGASTLTFCLRDHGGLDWSAVKAEVEEQFPGLKTDIYKMRDNGRRSMAKHTGEPCPHCSQKI